MEQSKTVIRLSYYMGGGRPVKSGQLAENFFSGKFDFPKSNQDYTVSIIDSMFLPVFSIFSDYLIENS